MLIIRLYFCLSNINKDLNTSSTTGSQSELQKPKTETFDWTPVTLKANIFSIQQVSYIWTDHRDDTVYVWLIIYALCFKWDVVPGYIIDFSQILAPLEDWITGLSLEKEKRTSVVMNTTLDMILGSMFSCHSPPVLQRPSNFSPCLFGLDCVGLFWVGLLKDYLTWFYFSCLYWARAQRAKAHL